jgi:4a-hydroxytetrahydrobiopterin dehydratase
MPALTDDEIREALEGLPGWRLGRGEIVRNYRFRTFRAAVDFIVGIADACERANHHPDLQNSYDRVRIGLHTWSEDAITEKDIALARDIEAVAGRSDLRGKG